MKSSLKPKLAEAFANGARLSKYDVAAMFHCTERWANDLLKTQPTFTRSIGFAHKAIRLLFMRLSESRPRSLSPSSMPTELNQAIEKLKTSSAA